MDNIRTPLSEEFKVAVRTSGIPVYRLGLLVGIRPPTFFAWLLGVNLPLRYDLRLQSIAKEIGFPIDKIFAEDSGTRTPRGSGRALETHNGGNNGNDATLRYSTKT